MPALGGSTLGGGALGSAPLAGAALGGSPQPGDSGASGLFLAPAVVAFINANLTAELGAAPTTPKAFVDAAPPGVAGKPPYVIVHDPDEHYERASDGSAYGYLIGDGHLYCVVKSAGKAQAHSIGLALINKLTVAADDGTIAIDEGTLDELVPLSGSSQPLTEVAPAGTPTTLTERTVGFHYKITYPSISA